MTEGYLSILDQLEEQGLLCQPQSRVLYTGGWTDDLPAPGYDAEKPRTRDIWTRGLAQMFSTISPRMFREFEVEYARRIFGRFGLVYYGCCEPLDAKMAEVRMIPNVRKVSMSAWVKGPERAAEGIGSDYVYSRKPDPQLLAFDTWDPEPVRADLTATVKACERHGCPLELILKDYVHVRNQPERLYEWARIAMQVVGAV